jgi:hypothetical protein
MTNEEQDAENREYMEAELLRTGKHPYDELSFSSMYVNPLIERYPWTQNLGQSIIPSYKGSLEPSAWSSLLFPPQSPIVSPISPEEIVGKKIGQGVVLSDANELSPPVMSEHDRRSQAIDQRIADAPIPIEPYVSPKMADTQTNTSFMDNLGGLLFGGGVDGMNDYLSPSQQKAIQNQAMMQAAASLLKSSGRTTQPISLGQALGEAYGAGTAGYQQAQQGALQQMMMRQKMDEYKRQMAMQDAAQRIMMGDTGTATAGTQITPQQALSLPESAVPRVDRGTATHNLTPERAEMIGQVMPGEAPSQQDATYDRYMKLSQLYSVSDPAKAKAYQELAKTIKPTPEVIGEPYRGSEGKFYQRTKTGGRIEIPAEEAPAAKPIGNMEQVTDVNGQPVLAQRYDDGTIKSIEGFGLPRELVQVNLGGKIQFVDKNKIPANATYLTGMSPGEEARLKIDQANLGIALKRLNLSQAEFQRGQYDRVETADGFAYVSKVPGMPIIPITDARGEQLVGKGAATEDQAKSAGFSLRMNQAKQIFNAPVIDPITQKPLVVGGKTVTLEDAFGAPGRYQAIMRNIPSAGLTTGIANLSESSGRQQYRQAQENWVTANLRAESGAVISTDEMEKEIKKYFPTVDDKPEVIKQKVQARKSAELAMEVRGGSALKAIKKAEQQGQLTGGLTWNPVTQQFE